MNPPNLWALGPRPDRALDEAVAVEVAGYRWVEWNHRALRGAPLDRPGRFLALPDDPLSHLHVEPGPGVRPTDDALAQVPHYSLLVDDAVRAAEAAGVFTDGGAVVGKSDDGRWHVHLLPAHAGVFDERLAVALCRAALLWVRRGRVR